LVEQFQFVRTPADDLATERNWAIAVVDDQDAEEPVQTLVGEEAFIPESGRGQPLRKGWSVDGAMPSPQEPLVGSLQQPEGIHSW
jgi:hypothetical protein